MLFSIGVDPFLVVLTIAFWMFAEEDGYVDYFECINAFNEYHILVMVDSVRKFVVDLVHLVSGDTNSSLLVRKKLLKELISTSTIFSLRPWEIYLKNLRSRN